VLVAAGSPVAAKALTHSTAKWPWLAARADGKQVLRLSYAGSLEVPLDTALADATFLTGIDVPTASVIDSATVHWKRPAPFAVPDDGVRYIGEGVAGSGLANVVRQATAVADALLLALEGNADESEPS
jgi:oxygen-dependent protoporphyrinogen oxidase